MEVPIPVGIIAIGVIGWEVYQYGDWVGPLGVAVMYFGYWIVSKSYRALHQGFIRLRDRLKADGVSDDEIEQLLSN